MRIVTNTEACTGCRMCELVCSFHHARVFSPELSSIRVSRNNRTSEIRLAIDSTCDLCPEEETLRCVESCCYGGLEDIEAHGHRQN